MERQTDMTFFSGIGNLARRYRNIRTHARTQRQIEALPFEIRKDIGWPQLCEQETAGERVKGPSRRRGARWG